MNRKERRKRERDDRLDYKSKARALQSGEAPTIINREFFGDRSISLLEWKDSHIFKYDILVSDENATLLSRAVAESLVEANYLYRKIKRNYFGEWTKENNERDS
jgi:hypothetical protein